MLSVNFPKLLIDNQDVIQALFVGECKKCIAIAIACGKTRSENLNNLISAYLNINTIGNKFDFPAEQVQGKSRHFDNFKN